MDIVLAVFAVVVIDPIDADLGQPFGFEDNPAVIASSTLRLPEVEEHQEHRRGLHGRFAVWPHILVDTAACSVGSKYGFHLLV